MSTQESLKNLASAITNEAICKEAFYEIRLTPQVPDEVRLRTYKMPKPIAIKDKALELQQIDILTSIAISLRRNRGEFLRMMQNSKTVWYSAGDPTITLEQDPEVPGTLLLSWEAVEAFV